MSQPFKTCPNCGQAAVPSMVKCGRCGFAYGEPGTPSKPRSRRIILVIIVIALALCGIAWGWFARVHLRTYSVQNVIDQRRDIDGSRIRVRAYIIDLGQAITFSSGGPATSMDALADRRQSGNIAEVQKLDIPPMIPLWNAGSNLHDGDLVEVTGHYDGKINRLDVENVTILQRNALPGAPSDIFRFGK